MAIVFGQVLDQIMWFDVMKAAASAGGHCRLSLKQVTRMTQMLCECSKKRNGTTGTYRGGVAASLSESSPILDL
jgi:hypothetical protein